MNTQDLIREECDWIKNFLLEKNRKYGDSAISPMRLFSRASSCEQIKVRIDDKLNRLINIQEDDQEDVVLDLIGYFILYRVAQKINEYQKNNV
jgi:hypothetical protein